MAPRSRQKQAMVCRLAKAHTMTVGRHLSRPMRPLRTRFFGASPETPLALAWQGIEIVADKGSTKTAVAYTRVSTSQQGRSGLGLEAQADAITRFAAAEGFKVAATYTEV